MNEHIACNLIGFLSWAIQRLHKPSSGLSQILQSDWLATSGLSAHRHRVEVNKQNGHFVVAFC